MLDKHFGVRLLPILLGVALVFVALAIALLAYGGLTADAGDPASDPSRSLELGLVTQKIPLDATDALDGNVSAYDTLERSTAALSSALDAGTIAGVGQPAAWQAYVDDARRIVAAREVVLGAHRAAADVQAEIPEMLAQMASVAGALAPERLAAQAGELERIEATGLRVGQDMHALASGAGDIQQIAQRLADDVDYLGQALSAFGVSDATGAGVAAVPPAVAAAAETQARIADIVRATISSTDQLVEAYAARARLSARVGELVEAVSRAASGRSAPPAATPLAWLPLALLAMALLALAALAIIHAATADVRRNAIKQARQNARNQEAILRLLDELSNLADGDLTVQATVTEDITGAIADSINYAIEALRELVATINDTAITLDASTRQTQATAGHLAKASVAQSKQVASATESMAAMASSVEEVSGNAERAADVARHSVDIAHKGGDAVRRTIDGMNTIRETIQETSKRIKRLGESSQEIGNIVELINDIAEQTNILALNASIQASMAGEAGRGFAVVADEVQRLAERAANATKQIEVLVRTIQSDTNEAVVSMERSTTDVVGGALLAENAGAALEEIEKVSNQIASLVQNISGSARQQASAAANISRNMQVLREISSQTAENTSATSTSIGKLAELATQLRKSVAGFRLPGIGGGTAVLGSTGPVPLEPEESREPRKVGGIA